jgi:hypothetical protein
MIGHRYKLPTDIIKVDCPDCKHKRTFRQYIDTTNNQIIHPIVGRCDRESNCSYHYTPSQYHADNGIISEKQNTIYQSTDGLKFDFKYSVLIVEDLKQLQGRKFDRVAKCWTINSKVITDKIKAFAIKYGFTIIETLPIPPPPPLSYIPIDTFKASLRGHEENHFVQFLIGLFGMEKTNELIKGYFIATSKHWIGATVFWQIDQQGNVRTGKVMLYNPDTGKRIKDRTNWVHKLIGQPEFNLKQCLFGEHLLIDKTKPVAIVESEKTAIIASAYFPDFIWLACGGLGNLSIEKCSVLKGRTVTLFPDLKGFDKWNSKATELGYSISDLLERKATDQEKQHGLDLADYLIKYSINDFNKQPFIEREVIVLSNGETIPTLAQLAKEAEQDRLKRVLS